ncbi:MAG TPA: imelysin family protein [Nannocystaceae bacterium]|nr:imelysin family protein [Nannocystaceae bacterium]
MNKPLFVSLAIVCACGESGPRGPSRGSVVADLVHDTALPHHESLGTSSAALPPAFEFCAAPNAAAITAAQDAWRLAASDWAGVEAFFYGPAKDDHVDAAVWFWPTRPELIEELLAGDAPIDAALVDGFGAADKGLPAIEAQLFDPTGGDVLTRFDPADPIAARRCALVRELAIDVGEHAGALAETWSSGYADDLAEPPNPRYEDERAALDEMVNGIIFLLQLVDDHKLGIPFGSKSNGMAQPDMVESRYADQSLAAIATNLATVRKLYLGVGDGLGLQDLVLARSPMLDDEIVLALDQADAAIAAIPPPLRVAVGDSFVPVQNAIDAVKQLRRLFTADLPQQLGVTVTISDNDGD